jgi:hypothetical protein
MFRTTKYSMAVRIKPEMTVPQSESSGFFIVRLLLVCGILRRCAVGDG